MQEIDKEVPVQQLNPARIKGAEYERTVWVVTVEKGTKLEHMQNPSFWSHVSNKLRPWDHIEVRSDDGTIYAEFLVLACDRTWAKVHKLRFESLTTSDVSQTQAAMEEFELEHRGPHLKWGVIRKSDRAVLKENLQTKGEARTWLEEYRKTVSA